MDIAGETGGELASLVAGEARPYDVMAALLRELETRAPTIAVLEDLHWADEATLDVVRLLGRRVHASPALVLASYRDDALGPVDPLRLVFGELPADRSIERVNVPPLSPVAVAHLAAPQGVDAGELYRRTAGNPFFVTESLAAGGEEIPPTVRDAILARAARLGPAARALLDVVAIVPPQLERWLLEALAPEAITKFDECMTSGMLVSRGGGVGYRHELARLAVEDAMPASRRDALHQQVVAALAAPARGAVDLARLAHHAEAAGVADAVLEFAPAAAARAASLGAHREAAAQYDRALRFAGGLPPERLAALLEPRARECFVTYQFDEAIDAHLRALDCHRECGDVRKEGDVLRSLAYLYWHVARVADAEETAREAIALLEQLPPGRELALAYTTLSQLYMNAEDTPAAVAWGARAIELAGHLEDIDVLVRTRITLATIDFMAAAPNGRQQLETDLVLAKEERLLEQVARAYTNLAWIAARRRLHDLVDNYVDEGVAYFAERDPTLWSPYLLAMKARSLLDRGSWAAAAATAERVIADRRATYALDRPLALAVLGTVRARRGDPEVWRALDEAFELVRPSGELQRIAPVAVARAEALWLEGRSESVGDETSVALDLARRRSAAWEVGALACWRRRAGIPEDASGAAEPYAFQLAGDWSQAARRWTELNSPYEAALALADADDADVLHRALVELQRLQARPAAAVVARRLRQRGARGLPRGLRPATRENPANLTGRELEVLALVADGLRNSDIAARLVITPKTVDHHVSAILRKLGVQTRRQASAEASRLGITPEDR